MQSFKYLISFVVISLGLTLASCGSVQDPAIQLAKKKAELESTYWQKCKTAAGIYDCQIFLQMYPTSYYASKAAQKIRSHEQVKTKKKDQQDSERLEAKFQRDGQLPVEMRRDKYMVALSAHLKNERYSEAMQYFDWLERLNTKLSSSFNFFYGEALLKTGKPTQAIQKLYAYIKKAGSNGKYYKRALEMANEAEAMEATSGPSTTTSELSAANCPELSMPLLEGIAESMPLTPGITFKRLTCFYGVNRQIKMQLAYPVGTANQACTDPKLQLNPKIMPNYRYMPVVSYPSQEVFIFGFAYQHVGGENGSHVAAVYPGSPAEKAGLLIEDLIVALDGDKQIVNNVADTLKVLGNRDETTLAIMREGQLRDITMNKFKFLAPKIVMLSNEDVLGSVILTLPGQLNDTQALINYGKALLDSVRNVAIRCN